MKNDFDDVIYIASYLEIIELERIRERIFEITSNAQNV